MSARKCIAVVLCMSAVALLTGCAGFANGSAQPNAVSSGVLFGDVTHPRLLNGHTEIQLTSADFRILKNVTAQGTSTNVLGLFSSGNNGYAALMRKAQALGADDVINIKADTQMVRIVGGF